MLLHQLIRITCCRECYLLGLVYFNLKQWPGLNHRTRLFQQKDDTVNYHLKCAIETVFPGTVIFYSHLYHQ